MPFLAGGARKANARAGAGLPFGYHVRRDSGLLILRRPDGSFVAAFTARDADAFEVELAVWEDAD